jgi:SAM-dependent methyltransferase
MPKTNNIYRYPDLDDNVTTSLIDSQESKKGDWERNEKDLLDKTSKYLQGNRREWLFDAGCGTGRLIPLFECFFNRVLAVDPDPTQILKAKQLTENLNLTSKVTLKVAPIESLDWQKETIDVILCSHVIQHVNTETVKLILQKFYTLSKPNGLLILTTAYAPAQDYYMINYLKQSKFFEHQITKDEFNGLITNEAAKLPIHFFSTETLQTLMKNAGFTCLEIQPYHPVKGTYGKYGFRDAFSVWQK